MSPDLIGLREHRRHSSSRGFTQAFIFAAGLIQLRLNSLARAYGSTGSLEAV